MRGLRNQRTPVSFPPQKAAAQLAEWGLNIQPLADKQERPSPI